MQITHTATRLFVCGLASSAAAAALAADRGPAAVAAPSPTAATAAAPTLSPAGEGRRLYLMLNCSGCHGARAGGGMGPKIVGQEAQDVLEKMQKGESGGMPAYPAQYVTTTNAANLGAYLRSIGTSSEPKFVDWWVAVPSK